jgi:hypothetical protein
MVYLIIFFIKFNMFYELYFDIYTYIIIIKYLLCLTNLSFT